MPDLSQSALDGLRSLLAELEEGAREIDALVAKGEIGVVEGSNFAAGIRFTINAIEVDFIGKGGIA